MAEYGVANQVPIAGDVYRYGILLPEMLTGKRPTHETLKGGLGLPKFLETAFLKRVMDIIDPCLLSEESNGEANDRIRDTGNTRKQECLVSILGIGLLCSKETPRERMQM